MSSGPSAVFLLLDDIAALDDLAADESYSPGFLSILNVDVISCFVLW